MAGISPDTTLKGCGVVKGSIAGDGAYELGALGALKGWHSVLKTPEQHNCQRQNNKDSDLELTFIERDVAWFVKSEVEILQHLSEPEALLIVDS